MSTATRRTGRRQSTERIRELVAIMGSLSRQGDRITLDALAQRMGLSLEEASQMMSIVCQASSDEFAGLLVSANDEMTEFTLVYPRIHGRPVRLTTAETIALLHALDVVGIDEHDALRTRLRAAYSSHEVNDREVCRALDTPADDGIGEALIVCARSQAESRMLYFTYCGMADSHPTTRCALVRNLRIIDTHWYIDAYDLDRLADRTFRIDRMSDIALGPTGMLPHTSTVGPDTATMVNVRFSDVSYLDIFEWPGLRIYKSTPTGIEGVLPYYGPSSDWLIRRIIACGGALQVEDDCIMARASEYARSLLEE